MGLIAVGVGLMHAMDQALLGPSSPPNPSLLLGLFLAASGIALALEVGGEYPFPRDGANLVAGVGANPIPTASEDLGRALGDRAGNPLGNELPFGDPFGGKVSKYYASPAVSIGEK